MPPVKGGATAGIGRRTDSPNPRFGLWLVAVGFGGVVAHRGLCWSDRECPRCRAERWELAGWHRGDICAARDLRRSRRSWNVHEFLRGPVFSVSR